MCITSPPSKHKKSLSRSSHSKRSYSDHHNRRRDSTSDDDESSVGPRPVYASGAQPHFTSGYPMGYFQPAAQHFAHAMHVQPQQTPQGVAGAQYRADLGHSTVTMGPSSGGAIRQAAYHIAHPAHQQQQEHSPDRSSQESLQSLAGHPHNTINMAPAGQSRNFNHAAYHQEEQSSSASSERGDEPDYYTGEELIHSLDNMGYRTHTRHQQAIALVTNTDWIHDAKHDPNKRFYHTPLLMANLSGTNPSKVRHELWKFQKFAEKESKAHGFTPVIWWDSQKNAGKPYKQRRTEGSEIVRRALERDDLVAIYRTEGLEIVVDRSALERDGHL